MNPLWLNYSLNITKLTIVKKQSMKLENRFFIEETGVIKTLNTHTKVM